MRIRRGVTQPYEYQLTRSDGTVVDLTLATTVKIKLIEDGAETYTINSETCVVVDPPTLGKVQYNWTALETGTPGFYWLSFLITWTGGKIEEVPSNGFDYILIL